MNIQLLIKSIEDQTDNTAVYVDDELIILNGKSVKLTGDLVHAHGYTFRYRDARDLLRRLREGGLIDGSYDTIDRIVHHYKKAVNGADPFLIQQRQSHAKR